MKIIGVGVDIVDNKRIKNHLKINNLFHVSFQKKK